MLYKGACRNERYPIVPIFAKIKISTIEEFL